VTRFDADLHRLATHLAAMVAAPVVTTAADDTAMVNRARQALRHCCRTMLADLTPGIADMPGQVPRLVDVALNPVGVLDRMLHDDPLRLELPPGKALKGVAEKANGQWKRLADATEVVVHEWSSSDPDSRPTGEHAWTRIADVAALTQAAAVLDRQFVDADKASLSVLDACSEVELVADHARQYATSGPLPHPAPLQPPPQRLAPRLVRGLADVPAGMAHLSALITRAGHLRPSMIAALATAHGRSMDAIAGALTATAPPGQRAARDRVAAALRHHGQSLATVALACRTLESIEQDDLRPAMQMRELRTALNPLTHRPRLAAGKNNQQALHAALRPALSASLAIETTTQSHIRSARWYAPAEGGLRLTWTKIGDDHPIHEALALVGAHGRALISKISPPQPPARPYQAPQEILAPALHHARPSRCSHSALPPAP
jgi:hypothetical protein